MIQQLRQSLDTKIVENESLIAQLKELQAALDKGDLHASKTTATSEIENQLAECQLKLSQAEEQHKTAR
jgi:hypothetical protein